MCVVIGEVRVSFCCKSASVSFVVFSQSSMFRIVPPIAAMLMMIQSCGILS